MRRCEHIKTTCKMSVCISHSTSFVQSKQNRIVYFYDEMSLRLWINRFCTKISIAQSERLAPHWFEPAESWSHVELFSESVYLVANEGRTECSNSQSEASREGLEEGTGFRSTTFSFGTQLFFCL